MIDENHPDFGILPGRHPNILPEVLGWLAVKVLTILGCTLLLIVSLPVAWFGTNSFKSRYIQRVDSLLG